MQRKIRWAIVLWVLVPCSAALAQAATQDITITAEVSGVCTIGGNAVGSPVGTALIPTPGGNVDTSPITPTGAPFTNVVCNGPSSLRLSSLSGGVVNAATASGFDNIINYSATASWNSVNATINTATVNGASGIENGTAAPVATAGSGSLTVTITPAANSQPLIAGSYSDTLRVTLTPQ